MKFLKMQATGNDFILIDLFREKIRRSFSNMAKKLCERHFGIGADGLIVLSPSKNADMKMRIFNPDGSEAEMCGNGIRCAVKYAYENFLKKREINVETLAGIIKTEIFLKNSRVSKIKVNMGIPRLSPTEIPVLLEGEKIVNREIKFDDKKIKITCVSMGNPHCVIFVKDLEKIDIETPGKKLEKYPIFPNRTNVEFVEVVDRNNIKVRVWERGVGETFSCGTGACASVVAGFLNGFLDRNVNVYLKGGKLQIFYDISRGVFLTGEAKAVFEGKTL